MILFQEVLLKKADYVKLLGWHFCWNLQSYYHYLFSKENFICFDDFIFEEGFFILLACYLYCYEFEVYYHYLFPFLSWETINFVKKYGCYSHFFPQRQQSLMKSDESTPNDSFPFLLLFLETQDERVLIFFSTFNILCQIIIFRISYLKKSLYQYRFTGSCFIDYVLTKIITLGDF